MASDDQGADHTKTERTGKTADGSSDTKVDLIKLGHLEALHKLLQLVGCELTSQGVKWFAAEKPEVWHIEGHANYKQRSDLSEPIPAGNAYAAQRQNFTDYTTGIRTTKVPPTVTHLLDTWKSADSRRYWTSNASP